MLHSLPLEAKPRPVRQFDRITLIVTPMRTLFTASRSVIDDPPAGTLLDARVHNTTKYGPWALAELEDNVFKARYNIDQVLVNAEHDEGLVWIRGWGPAQRAQLLLAQSAA